MERGEWNELISSLATSRDTISGWEPEPPAPVAVRCEQSFHRTLAHLRACQEQWLGVVRALLEEDEPRISILHPWRQFEQRNYGQLSWEAHLDKFLEDRETWLGLQSSDWTRAGKMNRTMVTVGELTRRLADHEAYHIKAVESYRLRRGHAC